MEGAKLIAHLNAIWESKIADLTETKAYTTYQHDIAEVFCPATNYYYGFYRYSGLRAITNRVAYEVMRQR